MSTIDNPTMEKAKASPGQLIRTLFFWKDQYKFLFIIMVSFAAFGVLFSTTYPRFHISMAITIIIHLLGLYAIYRASRTLAKIEIEHAVIDVVEDKAEQNDGSTSLELPELEKNILPVNPHKEQPAMIRLFRHICKEAKDRRFESSVIVIQPYREESAGDIFQVENIKKMALHLGILGTFIGLILALFELGAHSRGAFSLDSLDPLFHSLYISFSTSIAGLEVSVFVGAMTMLIGKRQQHYFQKMEDTVLTMLSLARKAINTDNLFSEFNQVRHSIDQLNGRVDEQTQKVSAQTHQIQQGINKLAAAGTQFDGFLNQISDSQKAFIDDIKGIYDIISLNNITKKLEEILKNTNDNLSKTLTDNLRQSSEKLLNFNENFRKELCDSQKTFIEDIRKSYDITAIKTTNEELQSTLVQAIEDVSQTLNSNLKQVSDKVVEFNSTFQDSMSQSQKSFVDDMKSIYDITSLKRMSEELQEVMKQTVEKVSEKLNDNLLLVSQKLAEFNNSPNQLNETLATFDTLIQSQVEMQKAFNSNWDEISQNTNNLDKTVRELNRVMQKTPSPHVRYM